jgi:hypothetical protein
MKTGLRFVHFPHYAAREAGDQGPDQGAMAAVARARMAGGVA